MLKRICLIAAVSVSTAAGFAPAQAMSHRSHMKPHTKCGVVISGAYRVSTCVTKQM